MLTDKAKTQKKYFKGKTFIASLRKGSQIFHCVEYMEEGLESPKGFYEWLNEQAENTGGVITFSDCK